MFRPLKGHHQVLSIKVIYSYTMNKSITDQLQYINRIQIINTRMQCSLYMSRILLYQAPDDDSLRAETCSAVFMIIYIICVVCNDGIILLLTAKPVLLYELISETGSKYFDWSCNILSVI
jgi:hypothetical protein